MAELRLSPNLVRRLESSERVLARCERVAGKGKAYVETIAPVVTGQYVGIEGAPEPGGFHIVRINKDGRTIVRLINTAPHAGFLEFGTRYMKRQRILGRTADYIRRG